MKQLFRRILKFDAHHRFGVALVVAGVTFALATGALSWTVRLIVAWDAFAASTLVMAWAGMLFTDVQTRVKEARLQDSSRAVIAAFVVLAAIAGLCASGLLLGTAKEVRGAEAHWHVLLAGLTVVLSWVLVHTVLTLHYAHMSYGLAEESPETPPDLGLSFPNEPAPDYLDFAYFSFVIGATCQVSDVQITGRAIRRVALLHGMLSFGFNTVILALTLNLASALL